MSPLNSKLVNSCI